MFYCYCQKIYLTGGFFIFLSMAGHILDLYCVQLLNGAPFCENYTKFYFDAKHLEKGLNVGE